LIDRDGTACTPRRGGRRGTRDGRNAEATLISPSSARPRILLARGRPRTVRRPVRIRLRAVGGRRPRDRRSAGPVPPLLARARLGPNRPQLGHFGDDPAVRSTSWAPGRDPRMGRPGQPRGPDHSCRTKVVASGHSNVGPPVRTPSTKSPPGSVSCKSVRYAGINGAYYGSGTRRPTPRGADGAGRIRRFALVTGIGEVFSLRRRPSRPTGPGEVLPPTRVTRCDGRRRRRFALVTPTRPIDEVREVPHRVTAPCAKSQGRINSPRLSEPPGRKTPTGRGVAMVTGGRASGQSGGRGLGLPGFADSSHLARARRRLLACARWLGRDAGGEECGGAG